MLDAFTRKTNDNSTKVWNYTDAFNTTSSWSQGISNVGNTEVQVNPEGGPLKQLVPVLMIGLVVVGLIAIGGRR
jgi:hypothetical protein